MRALLPLVALCLTIVVSPVFAQDARLLNSKSARVDRAQAGRPLTGSSSAAPGQIVRDFVATRHQAATLDALVTVKEHRGTRGALHVEYAQEVAGLRVHGAYLRASLSARGELLSVIDQLVEVPALVPARVSASDALEAVLRRHYPQVATPAEERAVGNTSYFARSATFPDAPHATRVAVPMEGGALHVGYLVETWDRDNILRHTVVGGDGRILLEELRTNNDTYRVFTNSPTRTPQADVSGPGSGNAESPGGWVPANTNTTTGNNVDAYLDTDNNNSADAGGRPTATSGSGATAAFLFNADLTVTPTTTDNRRVAVTNLFYLNNVIHDKLYRHGFTESAGNFQTDNFSNGGADGDPVNAEAQDGGGTNNANFATPADGSSPRMQMYLWTSATPSRDGDVDADVVFHEYGHGLTWRMIGSMSGPLAGAVGEGMSDTLAIYMNGDDAVGEYSYNRSTGIRRYRYEGYPNTYGDVTGSSVHGDGEIYAGTMWKLRSLWTAGGRTEDTLFDVVIDGMNFTPSRPAYEDMRDGILTAVGTDAAGACIVWDAFSQFGIGVGADGRERCRGFVCSVTITESFVKPEACGGPTPPPSQITLSAASTVAGKGWRVDLTWSGATGANVDVYRNGTRITTTTNDGSHNDRPKTAGTYTYKVCNASTASCSNDATVVLQASVK